LHGSGDPSTPAAADDSGSGSGVLVSASGDSATADSGALQQQPAASGGSGSGSGATTSAAAGAGVSQSRASSSIRVNKFHKLLSEPVVDLDALRELAWSGIPSELRPLCWRLLLGYLPPNRSRQAQVLTRKRREYADMVPEFYEIENSERSEDEIGALRQVSVDVPRTAPTVPFFHEPVIQKSLERMLYIWGIRWAAGCNRGRGCVCAACDGQPHNQMPAPADTDCNQPRPKAKPTHVDPTARHPASGYVQGMNDLVTPFLSVFLSDCLKGPVNEWGVEDLTEVRACGGIWGSVEGLTSSRRPRYSLQV
jgi:hypothetical protein